MTVDNMFGRVSGALKGILQPKGAPPAALKREVVTPEETQEEPKTRSKGRKSDRRSQRNHGFVIIDRLGKSQTVNSLRIAAMYSNGDLRNYHPRLGKLNLTVVQGAELRRLIKERMYPIIRKQRGLK